MTRYDGTPTRAEKKAANRAKYRADRSSPKSSPTRQSTSRSGGSLTPHQQQLMRDAESFASQHYGSNLSHDEKNIIGKRILTELFKAGIPPKVVAQTPTAAHHDMKLLTYLGDVGSSLRDTRESDPRRGLQLIAETDKRLKTASVERAKENEIEKKKAAAERKKTSALIERVLTPAARAHMNKHKYTIEDWFNHYGDGAFKEPAAVTKLRKIAEPLGLDAEELYEHVHDY